MLPYREQTLTLPNKSTFSFRNHFVTLFDLVFLYNLDQISIGRKTLDFPEI
jgi:hypothetical protein